MGHRPPFLRGFLHLWIVKVFAFLFSRSRKSSGNTDLKCKSVENRDRVFHKIRVFFKCFSNTKHVFSTSFLAISFESARFPAITHEKNSRFLAFLWVLARAGRNCRYTPVLHSNTTYSSEMMVMTESFHHFPQAYNTYGYIHMWWRVFNLLRRSSTHPTYTFSQPHIIHSVPHNTSLNLS